MKTTYGIAMERIWVGDILAIEDGRVRRIREGEFAKVAFPSAIDEIEYPVLKTVENLLK